MKKSGIIDQSGRDIPSSVVAAVRKQAGRPRAGVMGPSRSPWPYDATMLYGQEVGDWFPYNQSPDNEINIDADLNRARHRDLVRNDGWASGSIARIADGMVGSNFHVVPEPNWRALAWQFGPAFDAAWAAQFRSAVMAEWRTWADDPLFFCDVKRSMSMTQNFYLLARHKLMDGDALCMPLWMPERVGYGAARYATAIQVIDPDRLSNPYEMMDTHFMRGGVEVDNYGAPIAYHIRRAHQNDYYDTGLSMIWDRFERETAWGRPLVIHDCDRDRADQHRGVGILTPVLARFKVLAKYDQVALQAKIMKTVLGFFLKSPFDSEQIREAMQSGDDETELRLSGYQKMRYALGQEGLQINGMDVKTLAPGEDVVTTSVLGDADDFDVFEHTVLRSISAATGESAEEISKDYSKTNYSSARAAMLSVWRTMLRRRANFTTGVATPIYVCLLEEMFDQGKLPLPDGAPDFIAMRAAYARCSWIGPGRGWIDPVKERAGELMGLDGGFGTLKRTSAEINGAWWQDDADERKVEQEYFKDQGINQPDWQRGGIAEQIARTPEPQ
ncbi:MAG TPA: phage portal protein [Acidocella sp.]|jgi:lambda family phage portal protein|uniref:phage portal protein n=1 Tax=Acidocella sp. TaxID=50710 RepID=UPI002C534F76|nr:phage portal protein [Acidocella sp.]HVE20645.1 phage portal protein [Acidocella sp.]